MEHRWGLRYRFNEPVIFIDPGYSTGNGRMTEVSMSGAFIRTKLAPSNLIWIRIACVGRALAGEEREETAACVVRRSREGIAVEWVEYSPPAIRALIATHATSLVPVGQDEHLDECHDKHERENHPDDQVKRHSK